MGSGASSKLSDELKNATDTEIQDAFLGISPELQSKARSALTGSDLILPSPASNLVFVTGPTGAGKTTIANYLMVQHNFIHYDCDEVLRSKGTKEQEATRGMTQAWQKIWGGEQPEIETWQPFLDIIVEEIKQRRDNTFDKGLVVAFAVYTVAQRNYLKGKLGADLTFLVLEGNAEVLQKRSKDRTIEMAAALDGRSIDKLAAEFGMTAEAMIQSFGVQQKGFEKASGEPQAHSISVMQDAATLFEHVRRALQLDQPSGKMFGLEDLREIDTKRRVVEIRSILQDQAEARDCPNR